MAVEYFFTSRLTHLYLVDIFATVGSSRRIILVDAVRGLKYLTRWVPKVDVTPDCRSIVWIRAKCYTRTGWNYRLGKNEIACRCMGYGECSPRRHHHQQLK